MDKSHASTMQRAVMIDRALRAAVRPLRRAVRTSAQRLDSAAVARAAREIAAAGGRWTVGPTRHARSGTRIVSLLEGSTPAAYLKLTDAPDGAERLAREAELLALVADRVGDTSMRSLIPEVLGSGREGRWAYLVQRALPGVPATELTNDSASRAWILEAAAGVAQRLRDLTARSWRIGPTDVERWVDRPLQLVARLLPRSAANGPLLERVQTELRIALRDREMVVSLVHGDYWTENLLVDVAARRITGVVDWDSADPANLAVHDALHLVLYTRKLDNRTEIGDEVCRALRPDAEWTVAEQALLAAAVSSLPPGSGSLRTALLLYWLRLVAVNHDRQPRQTSARTWVTRNVDRVLSCI